MNDNFEEKEGMTITMGIIYDYYLDMCAMSGCNAVELPAFVKVSVPRSSSVTCLFLAHLQMIGSRFIFRREAQNPMFFRHTRQ